MSDPTLEEESLISQDDIDMLLDASSLEEAEEALDTPGESGGLDMDEVGELSQDDIDSLLSGPDEDDEPEADEGGELSQDDIDSLMGGGDDEDDEDMELISQDDIDSLMTDSETSAAADDGDEDDDELISMDDIQDLMGGDDAEEPPEIKPAAGPPEAGTTSAVPAVSDDTPGIEETLEEASPPEPATASGEEAPAAADPYDEVIADGDAVAVNDCLITQETMDELIRNAPEPQAAPAPDPVNLEEIPEPEPAPAAEADLDGPVDLGMDEGPVDLDGETVDLDASDDDLDGLLDEAGGDIDLDLGADTEGDVTQEDIDALLQESDDGDDFLDEDDDILISQDDIDTLLMAADQEDEDVLGDLLGDTIDEGMDDFEEQEIVSGSPEEGQEETDQVVLEGQEEVDQEVEGETSERMEKIKTLLKSKLVLAAASILLVLGISVPSVYFLFFSEKPVPLPEREAVPVAVQDGARDITVASVSIEEEPEPVMRQSGTIVLTDFLILASDLEKDMAYVYADISIDYSDQRAYHEISNNLSFYRDLIYEAIQTSLVSEKRNEVTESDLLWGVENSLKKVLPPHFIEKISFKTFRTS